MNVLSWNTKFSLDISREDGKLIFSDLKDGLRFLQDFEPDLAIVPEFGNHPPHPSLASNAEYLRRSVDGSNHKAMAVVVARGVLRTHEEGSEGQYLACEWNVDDTRIKIVAVHSQPPNYPKSVTDSLMRLGPWLQAGPVIFAGDFNANPALVVRGNSLQAFERLWNNFDRAGLVSAWHLAHGAGLNTSDPATLASSTNNTMIDYIFVSKAHFDVNHCCVADERGPSDHFPVVATIRRKTEGMPEERW